MKYILLWFIYFFPSIVFSQSLKGIWKGHFEVKQESGDKVYIDKYNFEIQLNQINNNELSGVTYSYKTKEYFAKATFIGKFNTSTKVLTIQESIISEVEKSVNSDVCKMLCALHYLKSGAKEFLTGDFTSFNQSNNKFCYSGTVELEKVKETSFTIEAFLRGVPKIKTYQKKIISVADSLSRKEGNVLVKVDSIPKNNKKIATVMPQIIKTIYKLSEEYNNRNNQLIETLRINEKEVNLSFFDNGVIDRDTISVFINGKLVINKRMIDYTPIKVSLLLNKENPIVEIIAVADNLGEYPPNTALMVLSLKNKRYEIPISTDFKINAKVIIELDESKDILIKHY